MLHRIITLLALFCGSCACVGVEKVPLSPSIQGQQPQSVIQPTEQGAEPTEEGSGFGVFEVPVNPQGLGNDRFDAIDDANAGEERPSGGELFAAPVPFRSPQLGWGLVGIGGYIFRFDPEEKEGPPSMVAIGGFYTENGSSMGFGGGRLHLDGDRWRIKFGGGYADIRYDFYGIGTGAGNEDRSLPFQSQASGVLIEPMMRFAPHWYLGPTYKHSTSETEIRSNVTVPPELKPDQFSATTAALGVAIEQDSRDDTFYPEAGSWLQAKFSFYDDVFGSDFDYRKLESSFASYHKLGQPDVLAWQVLWEDSGDAPFYDLSVHDFRGYIPGRYQDRIRLAGEVEYRRHLFWRIGGVAFAGLGQVTPSYSDFHADNLLPSVGLGIRFRLTEKNSMNYRIDVAWGRNGVQFYFAIGEAF
jgi:Omp85 superfamily domain